MLKRKQLYRSIKIENMTNTIGYFGDSFCAERINGHSLFHRYDSYMIKVEKEYNCKTVHTGMGGSGVWDLIINQFNSLDKIPDVCVFFWSKPGRLFHREVRKLSVGHVLQPKWYSYKLLKKPVYDAARSYYLHLQDWEKEKLEYLSAIEYFDRHTLSNINSKIIHFWSIDAADYKFINGVEIRPSVYNLSLINSTPDAMDADPRCNHLEGDIKNQLMFSWIKEAINNYQSGTLVDKSQEVDHLAT
jgi:hypothetical protein